MITPAEAQFIRDVVGGARYSQEKTGIPASITIAQAIVESMWGRSPLVRKGYNYFGIKAVQGQDYCQFPTQEDNGGAHLELAHFARYVSPSACFSAHAQLLANSKRYQPAMACCGAPAQFAEQLYKCGYSTNPQYAELLMSLIREFNLTQYDSPPPDPAAAAKGKAA
jgi:flagellar protein FlgJ